jgi:CheY-like chemotaxis protein
MKAIRILLVEDNEDDVELTLWALGQVGLKDVTVAWDGAEALRVLQAGPPADLVLLDLRLPLVDGLEVLARLRSDPVLKAIQVAVLTSSENPMDIAACRSLGVTAYLGKPLDGKALLAALAIPAHLRIEP